MDKKNPYILIVDDDANLLETMSDILKLKGFEPVIAQTGGTALEQLEKHDFELVLLDLRLEDMSGLILLRAIKMHSPETECILLTGHASQNSAIEAIQMGVYGYFQKPFDMEQVLLSIQRALEKSIAEKALRASEVRYRELFEDSPIALREEDFSEVKQYLDLLKKQGVTDFQKYLTLHPEVVLECAAKIKIVDVNKAALKMFRAESKNSMPINFTDILNSKTIEHFRDQLANIAAGQTQFSWEGIDHTIDGQQIDVEVNWLATAGHEEDLSKVIVSLQDITERKRAEEAVLESEERFRVIFERANDAIHIGNADDKILAVNSRMCELMGYSREELLKKHVMDLQAPEIRQSRNVIKTELERHGNAIFESLNLHRDGRRIPVEISIGTIEMPGGELYISVVRDITERKQAEEKLLASEAKFKAVFDNAPVGISLLDPNRKLLESNDMLERIVRISKEGMAAGAYRNRKYIRENGTEIPVSELASTRAVVEQQVIRNIVNGIIMEDGGVVWTQVSAAPLELPDPRIVVITQDITERKQAEEALQNSEKRFRALIENGRDNISLLSADGTLLWESPSTHSTLGYAPDQFVGHNIFELMHPDDQGLMQDLYAQIVQSPGKSQDGIFRLRHGDGTWLWIESTAANMLNEPSVQAIVINYRDITERKQAEEAQRQSNLQFRTLFELSPDAVMLIDPHDPDISWPIIDCNTAACQMNGYRREELIGHSVDIINLSPAPQVERNAYIERVRKAGNLQLETFHRHKNGTVFPIEVSTALIKVGDRELMIGIDRDITERKQAEDQLRQSEERFRQLANNIEETFWITDAASGREIYISPAAEKVWGMHVEDLYQGRYLFLENILPEDREIVLASIEKQLHGAKTETEYRIQHPDGSVSWVWDRAFPIADETGKVLRVAGITADITARKQAEIEIKERTEELELINALNEAVNRSDNLGKVMEVFTRELRKISICKDASIYLISSDEKNLIMQHLGLPLPLIKKIEQLIGGPIPQIQIPITEGGYFHQALQSEHGIITSDPKAIQQWMQEFTETNYLPAAARGATRKLIPQIFKLLNIRTTLIIPLISDKKVIGLLDVSSPEILTEKDLNRIGKISGQLTAVILREQVNEALIESEERYRSIFDGVLDAIFIETKDGRILEVNDSACEMYGYERNEILTKTVSDFVLEEGTIFAPHLNQPDNPSTSLETINRRANGDLFPIEITGRLQTINGEEVVLAIVRDITERKRAERALYESEERFKNAFQYSAIGMALVSLEGKWLKVNPMMCSIVGYSESELLAKTFQDITHPDDLNSDINYLNQLLAGEVETYTLEKRYFHKEGKIIWVLLAVALARDTTGAPLYFISQIDDITERKQAEEALRESEALYRQAIEVAGAVPYLQSYSNSGADIHYDFIGEGIRQITGYEAREFNAALLDSLIQESILLGELANYSFEDAIQRVRSGQIPLWKCEHRVRARDGKIHWVYESSVELYAENGVAKGSIGTFQDITERKLAEEETKLRLAFETMLADIQSIFLSVTFDNLDNAINHAQRRFCEFLGTDRSALWQGSINEPQVLCMTHLTTLDEIPLVPEGVTTNDLFPWFTKQLLEGKIVAVSDVLNLPPEAVIDRENLLHYGDKSTLAIPFSTGEPPVFGVLSFAATTKNATWSESVLTHCLLISQIISGVLVRKLAEENIRQRVKELELLYESGLAFSQLLNPKQIAQKIIELLGEKLDWHHTAIRLVRAQDELELLALEQPGQDNKMGAQAIEPRFNNLITSIDKGLSGWALKQSKIVRSGDVGSDPHYVASYPGIHSGLYVPLKSGNRMLGVISIESEQPNAFSEADEQLLTTLANQAANAFENARLYEETNLHAQELEQRVQERTADLSRVNVDLEHAVRVKDEFLASMSHELRTPLTGILGLSEVLRLKVYGELNDKQSKTLKTIEESGRHLLDLINDILDLSKIEAGKLDLQFAPCSLAEVCQASLQLIKGMAQHKGQHVYYAPPPKPVIIRADARRLKQALVNLLGNAIKFTPENGDLGLEIEAIESERKIKITVWDKGIGIRPENLSKLFKPFTQLDSGLAREYSGTGLGLSLVRHLTELHNGGIEVKSKIGEGSRFTIILPWSPHDTTPIPYPHLPQHAVTGRLSITSHKDLASPLVMVADDNETILQIVSDFLEAKKYRVITVRSGSELIERAAELHPSIMLVDIQMPGIGGLETMRRIRSHTDPLVATAPIVAITALAMPSDRENCLRAGANDYMSKPLKLNELAATIQKLLDERKP